MNTAYCPICEERILLGKKISILDRVCCPTCEALLEVLNTNPIEIDWIYFDDEFETYGRNRMQQTKKAICPLCREDVPIGSYMKEGHRVFCPGCDSVLEIVSVVPLELDWPYDGEYEYRYRDHNSFLDSYRDISYS